MTILFTRNEQNIFVPIQGEGNQDNDKFRKIDNWKDAAFQGGVAEQGPPFDPLVKCNFFPKNARAGVLSKMDVVISQMILMELVIERYFFRSDVSDKLAEMRCDLVKGLLELLTPDSEKDDPCLKAETGPGFRWVPKEPEQPRGTDGRFE